MKKVRWGIIGLGRIAHKFVEGLQSVENAELAGVASSNKARASKFAKQYGCKAYDSYEALAQSDEIDVIYIASFNTQHFEHSMLCLSNKKHVLCEKPLTLSSQESKHLFDFAASQHVFFMEAIWSRFLPSILFIEDLVKSEKYGKLKKLETDFGFVSQQTMQERHFNPELGGGALYDIGLYPIFLALLLCGEPEKIEFAVERCKTGCDVDSKGLFKYPDSEVAITCSFTKELSNESTLYFENAEVCLKAMWHCPTDVVVKTDKTEKVQFDWKGNGYNYEAQYVTDCILNKSFTADMMPAEISLGIIRKIEEILAL